MRILAIRGADLASLGGEFTVDFRSEPLASSGLFAISGPTGAGKSTLLDALCLALYDCTPRLTRAGSRGANLPDVRDDTIASQDPRGLMRRGAGEAYAEVDFVGNDGVAYRSRWTVRRARSRSDGKLQASEMRLVSLSDGRVIGGTKTDILAEIRTRLGLSFEQFTRSVLLAQNQFATFLQADDNERAELLETLTGTDRFTEISRRTFERCKSEHEALKGLQNRLSDSQPLNPPARAELHSAKASAEQVLAAIEKSRDDAEAGLRWHADLQSAREAEHTAQVSAREASAAVDQASARKRELAAVEAAQDARPLLFERDRSARILDESRKALERSEQVLTENRQLLTEAEAQFAEARDALRTEEERLRAAKPDLDRARSLDAEVGQLAPRRTEAEAALQAATADARLSSERLANKQTEHAEAAAASAAAGSWIDRHVGTETLAVEWPRWQTLLEQAERIRAEREAAEHELMRSKRQIDEARRDRDESAERLATAQKSYGDAERAVSRAVDLLAGFDPSEVAQALTSAQKERDLLIRGEQRWSELWDTVQRRGQLERASATLVTAIEGGEQRIVQLEADIPVAAAALEQAERSLHAAELACTDNVVELRADLEPGVPCPVCGSTAHPWISGQLKLDALLGTLRTEAAGCRDRLLALRSEAASERTGIQASRRQLQSIDVERRELDVRAAAAEALWQSWPLLSAIETVGETERLAWFESRQSAVQSQLEELAEREKAWRTAIAERDTARARVDAARTQLHSAEQHESTATVAVERLELGTKSVRTQIQSLNARLAQLLEDLDTPFAKDPTWKDEWLSGPAAFHQQCRQRVEEYRRQQEHLIELRARSQRLSSEIAALQDAADKAESSRTVRQAEFERVATNWRAAVEHRAKLLEGRPVDVFERELTGAVKAAAAELERHTAHLQEAQQALSSAAAMRDAAARHLADAAERSQAAQTALANWLDQPPPPLGEDDRSDLDFLRELLRYDGDWIAAERAHLTAIDRAAEREAAILQERQGARRAIELRRVTDQPASVLQSRRQAAEETLSTQRKRVAELDVKILQDDERRRTAEMLEAALGEKESELRTWAQLNEMIGSADGKKFRNFAQQLTLDLLLAYANRHLNDLTRRYRLERIPDTLGLMVVDQDMGDEIRSVHSLSGGETFLVSLGLALGLASLSSSRVRVESLFVDEGFGSLDGETLATAMDALDSLQSQGRKVGVISHVREMTERIATQIRVQRLANGLSRVEVVG